MADQQLVDFRCPTPGCGRLLFKVSSIDGVTVQAKCPRCKQNVTATLEADTEKH